MKKLGKLAVVIFLLSPMAANADLIEQDDIIFGLGSITLDTGTDLQWLDVSATVGCSINEVAVVQFCNGNSLAGWVLPTADQITQFWSNAGITGVSLAYLASKAAAVDALIANMGFTLITTTTKLHNAMYDATLVSGNFAQLASRTQIVSARSGFFIDVGLATREVDSNRAAYLVRSLVTVPEPGTLALLAIGLFGMGLSRRSKKA